jgi:dipeptidyl aminopeptidase/acylaminoacyl peptidase
LVDVDLTSGVARQVYPEKDGAAGVFAAKYSADGRRILVATDEGAAQGSSLVVLDATSLAPRAKAAFSGPSEGTVTGVLVSPRGDRIVAAFDLGHHNELRILDATSLAIQRKVQAPLGALTPGNFTQDGQRFTLTVSTPDTPPDVFVVDAKTGIATFLRADTRPGLGNLPALSTSIESARAFDGLPIPINVYLPKELPAGAKLPVIANFHGGPSNSSFVAWNYRARFFTSLGYAWVEPNIRGSTGFGRAFEMADNKEKRTDAMKDVETVNSWIKAEPWADPDRVVILGGSYGGYLVLMALSRQPTLWRAGVDLCGIVNLHTFMQSTDSGIRTILGPEFGDPDSETALLQAFSPFARVSEIVRPLFVYQGQNDPRVARSESDQIVASLRARGVAVEYMVSPNEGHSLERRDNRIEFLTRTARFLGDQLR